MEEIRKQFEQEAANTLGLPLQMIVDARKGDGYDHAYDSMNVMWPLATWWRWWQKSRAALAVELPNKITEENRLQNGHVLPEVASYDEAIDDCADAIREAGITVKGEGDLISTPDHVLDKKWHDHFRKG